MSSNGKNGSSAAPVKIGTVDDQGVTVVEGFIG